MDVVSVVTHLGGVARAFHGDQVVELRVRRHGRTGGSRRGEATQGSALMDDETQILCQRGVRQDEQVYKSARSAFMLR